MVNSFWLYPDPEPIMPLLADCHIGSSVFEGSEVLMTALKVNGLDDPEDKFWSGHLNHPLVHWASCHPVHWQKLYAYTEAAHDEWRYRYDHTDDEYHGAFELVQQAIASVSSVRSLDWPMFGIFDPPAVTGDWCGSKNYYPEVGYVEAYRYYYANEKASWAEWNKQRDRPHEFLQPYIKEDTKCYD